MKSDEEELALTLLKGDLWNDFGPTFAVEKLQELYGIQVISETLRKRMIAYGLWRPRGAKKKGRKLRERKRLFGSMIQLDGSPHRWFGETSCTLFVFIDYATSRLVHLEFVKGESVVDLMRATKTSIQMCGRPRSFYVYNAGVFRVNHNNQDHEKHSQWERAMKELDSSVIHAHCPQAKGRFERSNSTHQDRLIKDLRLSSIATLEEAQAFLPSYIEKHNRKFACSPSEETHAHRSIQGYCLETILCEHSSRKIQNDYTILYKKRIFQLTDERNIVYKPKDEIVVKELLNRSILLSIRGYTLEYKEVKKCPQKPTKERVYSTTKPPAMNRCTNDWLFKKKQYYYQPESIERTGHGVSKRGNYYFGQNRKKSPYVDTLLEPLTLRKFCTDASLKYEHLRFRRYLYSSTILMRAYFWLINHEISSVTIGSFNILNAINPSFR